MQLGREFVDTSILQDTMLSKDMTIAFIRFLMDVRAIDHPSEVLTDYAEETQALVYCWLIGLDITADISDDAWEEVSWLINEDLSDRLNDIAPEDTYFGSHPGNGTDYGFWSVEFVG